MSTLNTMELEGMAYDEAQRLIEVYFYACTPHTCIIESRNIPEEQREHFYRMVERELLLKGKKIRRKGGNFKIPEYQKKK